MSTTIASTEQYATWAGGQGLTPAPTGLEAALAQATAELQAFCGREFLPSPLDEDETETRTYYGDGGYTLWIDDALTVASIACGGAAVSDYTTRGTPITHLVRSAYAWTSDAAVQVTGRFGYAEVAALPAPLVEACCILAALRLSNTWDNLGVKRTTVINVTVEYSTDGREAKRQEALALARPYRRIF